MWPCPLSPAFPVPPQSYGRLARSWRNKDQMVPQGSRLCYGVLAQSVGGGVGSASGQCRAGVYDAGPALTRHGYIHQAWLIPDQIRGQSLLTPAVVFSLTDPLIHRSWHPVESCSTPNGIYRRGIPAVKGNARFRNLGRRDILAHLKVTHTHTVDRTDNFQRDPCGIIS